MPVDLETLKKEMTSWRRKLHAHPEFGFEEKRTSAFVAQMLRKFGFDEVVEGVGRTGIVGTLKRGGGNGMVALRADMDALRITEKGRQEYKSQSPGMMHACGHDGHTAMLLGAAKLLAEDGGFGGTVRFVFQPAEEWGKGALAMLNDGLLENFPFEEIFGLHNLPGLPVGHFQTRVGPIMSAEDSFEITLSGVGGHSAQPHRGNEVMVAACATVMNLQTIVSRRLSPNDAGVLSVTEIITDGTRNVLPSLARILGDARSFDPAVSSEIERQIRMIAAGTASSYQVSAEVAYKQEFVPLLNDAVLVEEAIKAAEIVFRSENISQTTGPMTASEDFARFLNQVPGCFVFVGNGNDSPPLHNPHYDFNDEGLLYGARWYATIARRRLRATQ